MNELPLTISNGDKYNPLMRVTEQDDADMMFERCVKHTMRCNIDLTRDQAEAIDRSNIGYWTGYFDSETAQRVNRLFKTQHPILGGQIRTPEEIFNLGMEMGKRIKDAAGG